MSVVESKSYLGDSVYAEFTRGMLRLTTDNGMGPCNRIFLEDEVVEALLRKLATNYDIDHMCRILQGCK